MSPVNCCECGKLVLHNIDGMCADCHQEMEMMISTIKDFLVKNGEVNLLELSTATAIPTEKLLKLLRSGRLAVL
ncbi:MAG: hypothetical protein ACOY4Q_09075 [Bacillota bacterium]